MEPTIALRQLRAASRACSRCLRERIRFATPALQAQPSRRSYSTTSDEPLRIQDRETERSAIPRWQRTPEGMSVPFRIRPKPKNNVWECNSDPVKTDAMYVRLLGEGGDRLLSDEVKWLAITHKSFDQGKRGFNDRLSYLGRRIVELQTSLVLVVDSNSSIPQSIPDQYGRIPFQHPQLSGLSNVTEFRKTELLSKGRLAQLANQYGITTVLRWKPKKAENLLGSGVELVSAQALYAIVGAISLERGGEAANKFVKEKILTPLGIV